MATQRFDSPSWLRISLLNATGSPIQFLVGHRPRDVPGAYWEWCRRDGSTLAMILKVANLLFVLGIIHAMLFVAFSWLGIVRPWWLSILVGSPILVTGGIGTLFCWAIAKRRFAAMLIANGFAVCFECGYSLLGNGDVAVCPECGQRIDLPALKEKWIAWVPLRQIRPNA